MGQAFGPTFEVYCCAGGRRHTLEESKKINRKVIPKGSRSPTELQPPLPRSEPVRVILHSGANDKCVLCITRNGCKNGGWVHMWSCGDELGIYSQWELLDGVLRSRADMKYVLCVHQNGLTNGGGLHMWEQGDQVNVFGKWRVQDGAIRAEADPRFCLCTTQNGCKDGGHVHMWCFDGVPPDKHGTWKVEEIDITCSGSPTGLRSPLQIPEPVMVLLRSGANDKYVLCVTRSGCKNGGWLHMWRCGDELDVYSQWEWFDGVLRSKADTQYVLCVHQNGLTNGGRLHMWEQGSEVNVFGKWRVQDGAIRAEADPRFCLCTTQNGCKDGGHLHMWCFDGVPPDQYGMWRVEKLNSDNCKVALGDCSGAGLLPPIVKNFELALSKPSEVLREPFVKGVEGFSAVLNQIGGGMGDYLLANTEKLRRSKADEHEASYKPWLLSELPVHADTGYRCYVDDSAWMGNLWIAWTLEFFVDLFAGLEVGENITTAGSNAYEQTLSKHHSMFQRAAFRRALGQLPSRAKMFKLLGQGTSESEVLQDIKAFVQSGRAITEFCLQMDAEISTVLENQRLGTKQIGCT